MSSDEEHESPAKEIGCRWFREVWNLRSQAAVRELMAPDAKGFLEGGQDVDGPEGFIRFQTLFFTAVPDLELEVIDCIAGENDVCVQWRAAGTHTGPGPGPGMPPTGKNISFRGVTWFRVQDGKIVEGRDFWNMDALMREMSSPPDE